MNKKAPIYRTCIVTREKILKKDMFRVVRTKSGIYFDINQDMEGRGVYIKKDLSTILLAQKRHSLSKGLSKEVDDSIYLELIQALSRERK
ncbi:MAG: YlxR family protein [Bacilli bacterium]|nr:YlxR family protein [Bacilli bacterium]